MEDLEELANRISFGGAYKIIEGKIYIIGDLTNEDRLFINFIIEQAKQEVADTNLISESELYSIVQSQGVWGPNQDKQIEGLKISIEELNLQIKSDISIGDKNRIKKLRSVMERNLTELMDKRSNIFASCDKSYIENKKLYALAYCLLYREDRSRFWPNWDSFLDADPTFINNVIRAINFLPIEVSSYRKITRANFWRSRWIGCSKNSTQLFSKNPSKLTQYQEMLIYWSQVYDSIFESYERPSEDIINNDGKLDKWLLEQSKKNKQEKAASGKSSLPIGKGAGRHGEVGIVVNPDTFFKDQQVPDINEVTELNSDNAHKFLAFQEKKIKDTVVIQEEKLRESKDARRIIGSQDAIVGKRKRSDGHTGRTIQQILPGGTL